MSPPPLHPHKGVGNAAYGESEAVADGLAQDFQRVGGGQAVGAVEGLFRRQFDVTAVPESPPEEAEEDDAGTQVEEHVIVEYTGEDPGEQHGRAHRVEGDAQPKEMLAAAQARPLLDLGDVVNRNLHEPRLSPPPPGPQKLPGKRRRHRPAGAAGSPRRRGGGVPRRRQDERSGKLGRRPLARRGAGGGGRCRPRAGRMRSLPQGGLPQGGLPQGGAPPPTRAAFPTRAVFPRRAPVACACAAWDLRRAKRSPHVLCVPAVGRHLHSFLRAPAFQNGGEILKESQGQGLCQKLPLPS